MAENELVFHVWNTLTIPCSYVLWSHSRCVCSPAVELEIIQLQFYMYVKKWPSLLIRSYKRKSSWESVGGVNRRGALNFALRSFRWKFQHTLGLITTYFHILEKRVFRLTWRDLLGILDGRFTVLVLLQLKVPLNITDLLTEKWEEGEERKIFCYCVYVYTYTCTESINHT